MPALTEPWDAKRATEIAVARERAIALIGTRTNAPAAREHPLLSIKPSPNNLVPPAPSPPDPPPELPPEAALRYFAGSLVLLLDDSDARTNGLPPRCRFGVVTFHGDIDFVLDGTENTIPFEFDECSHDVLPWSEPSSRNWANKLLKSLQAAPDWQRSLVEASETLKEADTALERAVFLCKFARDTISALKEDARSQVLCKFQQPNAMDYDELNEDVRWAKKNAAQAEAEEAAEEEALINPKAQVAREAAQAD